MLPATPTSLFFLHTSTTIIKTAKFYKYYSFWYPGNTIFQNSQFCNETGCKDHLHHFNLNARYHSSTCTPQIKSIIHKIQSVALVFHAQKNRNEKTKNKEFLCTNRTHLSEQSALEFQEIQFNQAIFSSIQVIWLIITQCQPQNTNLCKITLQLWAVIVLSPTAFLKSLSISCSQLCKVCNGFPTKLMCTHQTNDL